VFFPLANFCRATLLETFNLGDRLQLITDNLACAKRSVPEPAIPPQQLLLAARLAEGKEKWTNCPNRGEKQALDNLATLAQAFLNQKIFEDRPEL